MKLLKESPQKYLPHTYQKTAKNFMLKHPNSAIFLDPGLGKTAISLATLLTLKKKRGFNKALVIAPLRVCYNVWPNEIEKWSDFNGKLSLEVFHGRDPAEIKESTADIICVNFAYIQKLFAMEGSAFSFTPSRFRKAFGFDALIIDELSSFKHPKSKRFKLMKSIIDVFHYRWGLTGSPAANRLLDLFGQMLIIDSGATFGRYITHFRSQYFTPTGFKGYNYVIAGPEAEKQIYKKLKKNSLRMAAEDYLDLPELIYQDIHVKMPDKAYVRYKELHDDLITVLGNQDIVATSKAVALNKCRQVATGAIYGNPNNEDDKDVIEVHSAKYDALEELVEELQGKPLLLAFGFRHEAARLKKLYPKARFIYGGTSAKDSKKIIDDWNAGKVEMLCAHPASLAHGVNLQAVGQHICWLTLPWDFEHYDQFIRRVYRQGVKANAVFVHHIITDGTIDKTIQQLLKKKEINQQALFKALSEG